MSKVVNFRSVCLIWLVSLIGLQNVHAQKGRFSQEEKEIYSSSLAALKFDNEYPKRFGISPDLYSYVSYYLTGSSKHEVITYVRENNWWFIKDAVKEHKVEPITYFSTSKLLKHVDFVIKYNKTNALNFFSPVFYDTLTKRAIVVYEHHLGKAHNGGYNFGILFFEKQDNKWTLIKNISQFEILD